MAQQESRPGACRINHRMGVVGARGSDGAGRSGSALVKHSLRVLLLSGFTVVSIYMALVVGELPGMSSAYL